MGLAKNDRTWTHAVFICRPPTSNGRLPVFRSSWKRTMKKFTGKSRSSFDSPSKRIRTSWSASTRHSLITCTPLAQELIDLRQIFLSQHVHRTYNSYVLSQFKKLERDLRNHGQIRWKHVMTSDSAAAL